MSAPIVSPIDIAYIAGFFDGEGHIRILNHSRRSRTLTLQCSASQAEESPLDFIQNKFGGTLRRRNSKYRGKDRPIWEWQISSKGAEEFLDAVYPYLKCKSKEALVALAFRDTFGPQHVRGGQKKLPDEIIRLRENCKIALVEIRHEKRVN